MKTARFILGQGTGVGLTPVPAIAERLEAPGTVFAHTFTNREWVYYLGPNAEPLGGAPGAVRGGSGVEGSSSGGALAASLPSGGTSVPVNSTRSIELHAGSQALSRPGPCTPKSLGARWATKEATIKAWSSLIAPNPPTVPEEEVERSQIEVVHDPHRHPSLRFNDDIARALKELSAELRTDPEWSVSLSHEGGSALASVQVLALADPFGLEDRSPSS